ncbi:ABC transporter permease [Yersinia rochesterensis]|uniref:ABC transporter permease n=1 Tax=Yersinia rochesterensis TaxID=1604335 RepID=UPI0028534443|nr:ABC transporter permease [Yersinia rochesterensis]MDR5018918.1 ABC transporter permease [Yersinia rochesterensis]
MRDLKYKNIFITTTTLIIFIVVWQLVSLSGKFSVYILPKPITVVKTAYELLVSGELIRHLLISLERIFWGYLLAIIISSILTLLLCSSSVIKSIIDPPLNFLRQIPPLALLPLLLAWVGIGEEQKIAVIILGCLFPILFNFIGGVEQVDKKLIDVAKVLKFNQSEIFYRIYLPSALPSILIGLRVGLGFSWRSLVGAELIASSAGLGYMMLDAESLARTDIILVGVFVIGCMGMLTDYLLSKLINKLSPWHAQEK